MATNQTILQINDFTLDGYIWNVLTCGQNVTATECALAEFNYTFALGINTTDLTYNADVTEGSLQTFKINVTTMSGVTVTESNLIYNNTNFGGAWTSFGGE
ncbi:unnamed protein product [marine sediment metagenome]|uniref:Uncharacterized protein n=1 Tax=marine sediment metagenome TaxID=412755 RepID=X1GQP3_9ZZZZ